MNEAKQWPDCGCTDGADPDEPVDRGFICPHDSRGYRIDKARTDLTSERLRGAVIVLVKSMVPHPTDHPTMHAAWTKAKALLDEDPCEPKDACLEPGRCWIHSDENPSEIDVASENARAFLANMAERGVLTIEDEALRYHLALLLKRCSEPTRLDVDLLLARLKDSIDLWAPQLADVARDNIYVSIRTYLNAVAPTGSTPT